MASKTKSLVLPPGIGSYVTVLEPRADQKGKLKYSLTLLISKTRAAELQPLKAAMLEVAKAKWGEKGETILKMAKHPLIKDGDTILDEDTGKVKHGYAGMYAISMRSDRRPQVIDAQKNPCVTDEDVYSGCMIRVQGNVFAYEAEGNKGVSFGLNNVQVLKKLERFDGRKSADEVFEEWKDPDAPTGTDPLA